MPIVKLSQSAALSCAAIGAPVAVAAPLGEPVSLTRNVCVTDPAEPVQSGVWECTPGSWRRQVLRAEFSHFLAGACRFTPDQGEPVELRAGDSVYFPPGTAGTWTITETVRKVYLIVDPAPQR
jgi:uncharacterized cupin superfamily protein